MPLRLLIASGNEHKIGELRTLVNIGGVEIVSPRDLGLRLTVDETGDSYEENATLKAHAYARASGLLSFADDSGLEVDALGGAPGVYSARFGGEGLSDGERVALLLERLRDVPAELRRARFRCVVVLAAADGRTWRAEGSCEGAIALAPRGSEGFGYDPIFLVAGGQRTMAELTSEEKNLISHRARAVAGLRPVLARLAEGPRTVQENHAGDGTDQEPLPGETSPLS